jgi:hypothetical protein
MIVGEIQTPAGLIHKVATRLNVNDRFGAIKVRWLISRNNYKVEPGLYAAGNPTDASDVFVTANYKLSFDHLRKNLDGMDAWIMVLDTKGVNVWCAAGKGTFGTQELINRIRTTQLEKIISHRKIIIPQLGATGISAWQVKKYTTPAKPSLAIQTNPTQSSISVDNGLKPEKGFQVVFGPVRAADIRDFIANRYQTTPAMRKVHFNFYDRLKLTPVDLVYARYKLLAAFAVIIILSGLNHTGISFKQAIEKGLPALLNITLAYFTGILVTPLLLPYIPFRMFAAKGLITGIILSAILYFSGLLGHTSIEIVSWLLILSGISSFMAMNFTGASTFTSLSGVKKEMKVFVPVQVVFASAGIILLVINNLTNY